MQERISPAAHQHAQIHGFGVQQRDCVQDLGIFKVLQSAAQSKLCQNSRHSWKLSVHCRLFLCRNAILGLQIFKNNCRRCPAVQKQRKKPCCPHHQILLGSKISCC